MKRPVGFCDLLYYHACTCHFSATDMIRYVKIICISVTDLITEIGGPTMHCQSASCDILKKNRCFARREFLSLKDTTLERADFQVVAGQSFPGQDKLNSK